MITLAVIVNGKRMELSVEPSVTLIGLKALIARADPSFEDLPVGIEHLFGPVVSRGKKLDDSKTLEASGVHNRDKLMVSYMPFVKESLEKIAAVRAETLKLEELRRGGASVHADLFTRQMVQLDAIDLTQLEGEAKEVLRTIRKRDLQHLAEIEGHRPAAEQTGALPSGQSA
jgi:hypothetical protein